MFHFYNQPSSPAPKRQTMSYPRVVHVTNTVIINIGTLPPATDQDPRSPRVSISEQKPITNVKKKWCGLC